MKTIILILAITQLIASIVVIYLQRDIKVERTKTLKEKSNKEIDIAFEDYHNEWLCFKSFIVFKQPKTFSEWLKIRELFEKLHPNNKYNLTGYQ